MDELFRSYLGFLRSISQGLESLTGLNEKKHAATESGDLLTLNELLNQEQAQALNFRGLELTRDRLLPQLKLTGVPLAKVPDRFPPAMREEARRTVEELKERYQRYQEVSAKTRSLLEQSLREVDGFVTRLGGPPPAAQTGPGYGKEPESDTPPALKTDFRA